MNNDGFELLSEKVDLIVEAVDGLKTDLDSVKTDLGSVKNDLSSVKADLNTKASKQDFERLFVQMQERFDSFESKLDEKAPRKDINRVFDILDIHTEQLDFLKIELLSLSAKVDRFHPV